MNTPQTERTIYDLFRFGVWFKALQAFLEMLAGIAVFFIKPSAVMFFVNALTADELSDDPHDLIANSIISLAHTYSASAHLFLALYLASHGVVKLFVAGALLRNKVWAYPLGIGVFGLFILYQTYEFFLRYSYTFLGLTLIDLVIIWFIWREWRIVERHRHESSVH